MSALDQPKKPHTEVSKSTWNAWQKSATGGVAQYALRSLDFFDGVFAKEEYALSPPTVIFAGLKYIFRYVTAGEYTKSFQAVRVSFWERYRAVSFPQVKMRQHQQEKWKKNATHRRSGRPPRSKTFDRHWVAGSPFPRWKCSSWLKCSHSPFSLRMQGLSSLVLSEMFAVPLFAVEWSAQKS